MIVGISLREWPHPDELGHRFDTKENQQELPVFHEIRYRDIHAAFDEEEGGNHGKGDNAQLALERLVLLEHRGEREPEDEDGKDGVALAPFAQGHEEKQQEEEALDLWFNDPGAIPLKHPRKVARHEPDDASRPDEKPGRVETPFRKREVQ